MFNFPLANQLMYFSIQNLLKEMRWGNWTKLKAEEALSHLKKVVFPSLVNLADEKSSFGEYMQTAECKINKASLVIEACNQSAGMVARVEGLRGRMSEAGRQVEGLFESMLSESFGG